MNVVGIIEGEYEPDKYVLLGNHRDAWGYGAVDPSSGTAQMMEVSREEGARRRDQWFMGLKFTAYYGEAEYVLLNG